MPTYRIALRGQAVDFSFPDDLCAGLGELVAWGEPVDADAGGVAIVPGAIEKTYSVFRDEIAVAASVPPEAAINVALDRIAYGLIVDLDDAVALHAASVGIGDSAVLIAGSTGSGKTSLAAWLVSRGFDFLSDEIAVAADGRVFTFPRPLLTKSRSDAVIELLKLHAGATATAAGPGAALSIPGSRPRTTTPGLLVFPRFEPAAPLRLGPLSAGRALLRLMEANLNARNLPDHGLAVLRDMAAKVPALEIRFPGFDALENVLDPLCAAIAGERLSPSAAQAVLGAVQTALARAAHPQKPVATRPPPPPEPPHPIRPKPSVAPKLTIGMATYDDYDGVFFTVQAIRMFHPEIAGDIEFVIVDNNPGGRGAKALRALESWAPELRYVPNTEVNGTAVRDFVFAEASGTFALCLDCHVLVAPGALAKLLDYMARNPESRDLLQGPLVYDDVRTISTHFNPEWRNGMFGTWGTDPAGEDPAAPPFEIPMQGLGLFACRREAWPGFNRRFRGFGGEEGYIHEKIRRRGGKVLCLPFLRWLHRFQRPFGTPYPNNWPDRIHNYLVGFRELGWDTGPIEEHFRAHLGESSAARILADVRRELGADAEAEHLRT